MKKAGKIAGRVAVGLALTLYIAVALVNYSVVQSYIGTAVGHRLSREWGGTVRIGSLHAMPWDHLIANEILLVAPDGDTILNAEQLRVRFKRFPYRKGDDPEVSDTLGRLVFDRVYLKNAYYHFERYDNADTAGGRLNNLSFIVNHYKKDKKKPKSGRVFLVEVGTLSLNHVHYRMDLPDRRHHVYEEGVEIPHMEFYDICGKLQGIRVANDDITARIVRLSTEERSGFIVKNISGDVHVCRSSITAHNLHIETPKTLIVADAEMHYGHWKRMKHYVHTVEHRLWLNEKTTVAMSDVAYWAPALWGIDLQLTAEGSAYGTIDSLVTEGLTIGYGDGMRATVAGSVQGLPSIKKTTFDIEHLLVRSDERDLRHFAEGWPNLLPPALTERLLQAGYIDMRAEAHGGLQGAATINMDIASGLGDLRADATTMTTAHGRHVNLEAGSTGLDLSMLGTRWLTHGGLAMSVNADLPNDIKDYRKLTAEADVELTHSVVQGQRLNPVDLHAKMADGTVRFDAHCSDTLARFDAEGSLRLGDSVRGYHIDLDVDHFQADAFGLTDKKWGEMSTHAVANFKGNNIDEMQGAVALYRIHAGPVRMRELTMQSTGSGRRKALRLDCDAMNASMQGNFDYRDLPLMVQHTLTEMLPAELHLAKPIDSAALATLDGKRMDFTLQWDDNGSLLHAVNERLTVAKGTRLSGSYNSGELLKLVLRSDSVRMGGVAIESLGVSGRRNGDTYRLEAEAPEMHIGKMDLLRDVNVTLTGNSRRATVGALWGNSESATRGDLLLKLENGLVQVERPNLQIGETEWILDIDSLALSNEGRFRLAGKGISLSSDQQRIDARIALKGKRNDCVELDFEQFGLEELCNVLLQGSNINVGGNVDGRFSMYGFGETPYFNANLEVDSCVVNRQSLGDVKVRSNWNAELNILNLQLASDQLDAHGWMGLGKKEPDLNFAVDFDSFELALAAPFMSSFSSRFEGQLHGTFDISGTTAKPIIIGEALVENGALKVDVTGVTYRFNDSIRFSNNTVTLDRFKVLDPRGNIAFANGTIRYQDMKTIGLDLNVETDNLLVLDQPRGEQFYGTLVAAARGTLKGPIDDLHIVCSARTRPGCTLTVPVSSQKQVKAQNYITFVSDIPETEETQATAQKRKSRLELEFDLSITPDVQLNLPMNFSEVTVDVGATGNGDLHLSLTGGQTPSVIGNYEITSGTMKLGMLSLFEKNFTIENGSNLGFQGSLPDARFDLRAVYSQRVNLSTLTGSLSAIDNTQKYLQVENIIAIAGTLQDPTIGFDLRLPNADASVEEEVFAYIDRNSERDMINQTMSLLLMGQFYNANGADNGSTVNNSLSGGYSMVASSVSSIVSDMVQFVDVDVNYKAGNDITKDQVDVNISKDWGQWYLESTLGYGGENRELDPGTTNGTVLDALIGYRLSPLVHLFAYNRTNTNDYTRMDLPYKQGVGLKLTKDFDRWSDLFNGKKEKRKGKRK